MRDTRVWLNARAANLAALEAAVATAGGEVCTDPEDANAIIWAADDPPSIRHYLNSSIEWVQLSSAGIEDWFEAGVIDTERTWTAAKGVYARPIAEYIVAMLLLAARHLQRVVNLSDWQPLDVEMLAGKTVGIIGAGGIGEAVLELLVPFEVRTIAMTRSGRKVSRADVSVGPDTLREMLPQCDHLVLAAPDTAQTNRLLSADELALLPSHAWIVNVGRGTIIDTDALVRALAAGRLGGASLDVTDPEPLPGGHPLWSQPNAIITSHTACTQRLGAERFAQRVGDNTTRFREGRALIGQVDPAAGY